MRESVSNETVLEGRMFSENERSLLQETFLFQNCRMEEIEQKLVNSGAYVRSFIRKEVIYSPGAFRRELGILLSGKVRVSKGEDLVVSELTAGSIFGAAALYNSEEDYVSTLTARSETKILFLPQDTVSELIDENKVIRENYIRYLSQRIRFLSDKVDALSYGSGVKKLAAFLKKNMNEDGIVTLTISMTELSGRLDTSRASLYRDMDQLERAGILTRDGKTITILKKEELSSLR